MALTELIESSVQHEIRQQEAADELCLQLAKERRRPTPDEETFLRHMNRIDRPPGPLADKQVNALLAAFRQVVSLKKTAGTPESQSAAEKHLAKLQKSHPAKIKKLRAELNELLWKCEELEQEVTLAERQVEQIRKAKERLRSNNLLPIWIRQRHAAIARRIHEGVGKDYRQKRSLFEQHKTALDLANRSDDNREKLSFAKAHGCTVNHLTAKPTPETGNRGMSVLRLNPTKWQALVSQARDELPVLAEQVETLKTAFEEQLAEAEKILDHWNVVELDP